MKENSETPQNTTPQEVGRGRLKFALVLLFGSQGVAGLIYGISWLTTGRGSSFFDTRPGSWVKILFCLLWLAGFVMLFGAFNKPKARTEVGKSEDPSQRG